LDCTEIYELMAGERLTLPRWAFLLKRRFGRRPGRD
jgi:hypothetical protein